MRSLALLLPLFAMACTTGEPDPPGRQTIIVTDVSASMQHGQIGQVRNGVQTFLDEVNADNVPRDSVGIEIFAGEELPTFSGLRRISSSYDVLSDRASDLDWCASLDAADLPPFPGQDLCGSAPWRGIDNAVDLLGDDGHDDHETIILLLSAAPDCSTDGCGPLDSPLAKSQTELAIDDAWDRGINVWPISVYGPYPSPTAWTQTLARGDGQSFVGPAVDVPPFMTIIAGQL